MPNRRFLLLGAALGLSACAAGPDYKPPSSASLGVPASYDNDRRGVPQDAAALASWWTQLGDPALNALIDRAVANNTDLAQAEARLRQAREALRQASSAYLPQVGASGSAGQRYNSAAGGSVVDSQGNIISSGASRWTGSYAIGLDASWQLDLFGGVRRSVEAARADRAASGFSLAQVRTAIIAELVTNYVQVRLAQEQLRIARETLRFETDNNQIAGWRLQAGLASSLDTEQARASLAQTTASIPNIESQVEAALNRIAVLTGQAPGDATRTLETAAPIPSAPRDAAAGIPADTLRQRPDVRAAERTLAAATARIGVAEADLYPNLGLSGNVGTSATRIGSLTDIITGGIFANLAQTLFDGGARQSRVRAQEAAADAAFAAYKGTVLLALEEVENAVQSLRAAQAREVQLRIAYEASNNSAILQRTQYRSGLTSFQDLLLAEQSLLNARNSLAAVRADQTLAIVQLYTALGGGWSATSLPETATP